MKFQDVSNIKKEIQNLCSTKEFFEALKQIEYVLSYSPLYTPFLVLKAQILQLLDSGYEEYGGLDAIKAMLRNVVLVDESNIEARLELVYFLYNVEDDQRAALSEINKAIEISQKQLEECKKLKEEIESSGF